MTLSRPAPALRLAHYVRTAARPAGRARYLYPLSLGEGRVRDFRNHLTYFQGGNS